jgi:hypothetical protein
MIGIVRSKRAPLFGAGLGKSLSLKAAAVGSPRPAIGPQKLTTSISWYCVSTHARSCASKPTVSGSTGQTSLAVLFIIACFTIAQPGSSHRAVSMTLNSSRSTGMLWLVYWIPGSPLSGSATPLPLLSVAAT